MPVEPIFLSHYSGDAPEVNQLATSFRLHGLVPWVDKDGGLMLADVAKEEILSAIGEKCCGFLLYGTKNAFDRSFVCEVEIPAAVERRERDPDFHLLAIPRVIDFTELSDLSVEKVGEDLSHFHSIPIPLGCNLVEECDKVARGLIEKVLTRAAAVGRPAAIKLQLTSFVPVPDEQDDWLRIDARSLLSSGRPDVDGHRRLTSALIGIRNGVSLVAGQPRIYVYGNRHLAASFIFGRVFNRFVVDSRQGDGDVWSSDALSASGEAPFDVSLEMLNPSVRSLVVEMVSGDKSVRSGVDDLICAGRLPIGVRLSLQPKSGPLEVTNELCRSMVDQAFSAIDKVVAQHGIQHIHIFSAVPQSFMLMLGLRFSAMPDVHLYDWDGGHYHLCCCVPGGRR